MPKFTHSLLLLSSAGAFVPSVSAIASEKAAAKPNILFICIDDLRTQLGAYDNDFMITPNLDAIAKDSRLFKRHYVQVPTSGSSRACLLSGMPMPSSESIGHHYLARLLLGKPEVEMPETFIHHLKRNGYYTLGLGKISHQQSGLYTQKGNNSLELPHSWNKFITDPTEGKWSNILHAYADGKVRVRGTDNPVMQFLEREDEDYPDGVIAKVAVKELEGLAKKGEPFFMAVGFHKPHLPFSAPKKYWDMYQDKDLAISPNPDLPKDVSDVFLHPSGECFKTYVHKEYGGQGKRVSDSYAKDLRRAYYSALTYTDAQVGKVIAKLKELGEYENTIIFVWGDHGWHLGDQTIWGKHSGFERALASVLMVKTPGMNKPGVETESLVASLDIYPTICELAGVKAPETIAGTSFVPILKNPKAETRDVVMSYWNNMLSMRTDKYRFAVHIKKGVRNVMLFDHDKDPNESVNIAAQNPKLVEELTQIMKKHNNGFLPEL